MATRFHIDAVFKALDKFSAPVARMTTSMQRFTRRVRKGMGGIAKMTNRMARGFRNSALTLGSLAVMGGFALKGLVGPATRFEHAMDGVNAVVLGAYTKHMPKLRAAALELGKKTTFTATQVANAMEVLAKSGLKADETLALIEPTLRGAEAAGSDISTMADIMVSTIAQMKKLTPADGTTVIDKYAVAASSANTTLEELGEGMKKVIPIGETLNFKFEDLLATTTLLQHMGIEASMSAAQQRTFFTRLASLTPKAAKRFKGLGIDILKEDKSGDVKELPNLLAAIAKGFAKIKGNQGQIKTMAEAVGLRGGIAGNILIRNMGQLEELLIKIGTKSEGAAEKMSEMRLDNLFGDIVRLKSAWEFFRIEMADDTLPAFRDMVTSMTEWLKDTDNIKAASEKWESAVLSLKSFWNGNKTEIKAFGSELLTIVTLMWETAKMLRVMADYMWPDFLGGPKDWYGTPGVDAATKKAHQTYEAGGSLPPGAEDAMTVKHMGKAVEVNAKEPALLYIELGDGLKAREGAFGAGLGFGPSIVVRPNGGLE